MNPARWIVLTVRVPSAELADELAEGLVALGGTAVQEDGDALTTYVPEPDVPEEFLDRAAGLLTGILGGEPELVWRWQDHEDWSARWRDGLEPRRVGPRIVVTQPWNPVEPSDDDVVLVIDPSSAFGTGEHPTTRGALRLLQETVRGGERVLDVGAGSAILSLAAVRLGAASALGVELDPGAMETAADNVARAGLEDRIELVNDRVDAEYLQGTEPYDLIVANVLSGVLRPLLAPFRSAVADDGALILGGIMTDEAAELKDAARSAGWSLAAEDVEGEWWTALLRPHS